MPYPYAKYAQVAVSDFIFGGMENTSATTQTADTLHDARAHLDFKSDPLVAHELAHQWWGDLLTCRDWAHAWLNEGFATYFEALWCEENLGADEFAWNVRQDREAYLEEDGNHYRRPIVCNRYRTPIELFDRHLYEKGSLVLHMLRRESATICFSARSTSIARAIAAATSSHRICSGRSRRPPAGISIISSTSGFTRRVIPKLKLRARSTTKRNCLASRSSRRKRPVTRLGCSNFPSPSR